MSALQLLKSMGRPVSSFLDLDLHAPAYVVDFLWRATGQSVHAIHEMSLGAVFGVEDTASFDRWHSHWCLHKVFRSRRTTTARSSVCVLCLQRDIQYIRKSWRLSWVTRCTVHDCMLEDRCCQCGEVIETGLLRQSPVSVCEQCGTELKVREDDTNETRDGVHWKHHARDIRWLLRILETVPLTTLRDVLETRMDRWFFHTLGHLAGSTEQAKHSFETLSRHPPSRIAIGCMHIRERHALFSLLEQMAHSSEGL